MQKLLLCVLFLCGIFFAQAIIEKRHSVFKGDVDIQGCPRVEGAFDIRKGLKFGPDFVANPVPTDSRYKYDPKQGPLDPTMWIQVCEPKSGLATDDYEETFRFDGANGGVMAVGYKLSQYKAPGCEADWIITPWGEWKGETDNLLGPKGQPGDQGPQGPKGVLGNPGLQGGVGPGGPVGLQGEVGEPGMPGMQGEMGDIGDMGPKGEIGPEGIPGPDGPEGPIGEQGFQGLQGDQGPQGSQGPKGEQGPKGDMGITGIDGLEGDIGEPGVDGTTVTPPQGEEGDDGEQGPPGPPGPVGDRPPDDFGNPGRTLCRDRPFYYLIPNTDFDLLVANEVVFFEATSPNDVRLVGTSGNENIDFSFFAPSCTMVCKEVLFQGMGYWNPERIRPNQLVDARTLNLTGNNDYHWVLPNQPVDGEPDLTAAAASGTREDKQQLQAGRNYTCSPPRYTVGWTTSFIARSTGDLANTDNRCLAYIRVDVQGKVLAYRIGECTPSFNNGGQFDFFSHLDFEGFHYFANIDNSFFEDQAENPEWYTYFFVGAQYPGDSQVFTDTRIE